ncbi:hypothetical protein SYJ56_14970 [Algoriphagus sp. D3-2-R+10]|nr:hypothetical protein [Algoriphagus sp. D3-2-R+10]MEB2776624.1 hypothetical protein [Algoriphagus sp. D3-2-R+10]
MKSSLPTGPGRHDEERHTEGDYFPGKIPSRFLRHGTGVTVERKI